MSSQRCPCGNFSNGSGRCNSCLKKISASEGKAPEKVFPLQKVEDSKKPTSEDSKGKNHDLQTFLHRIDGETLASIKGDDDDFTCEILECCLAMHRDLMDEKDSDCTGLFSDRIVLFSELGKELRQINELPPRWVVFDMSASNIDVFQGEIQSGQILCFLPSASTGVTLKVSLSKSPSVAMSIAGCFYQATEFGLFSCTYATSAFETTTQRLLCVTPAFEAARALDLLFDCVFWVSDTANIPHHTAIVNSRDDVLA
jgi:hypothetical protein